jgi:hypothetical protein
MKQAVLALTLLVAVSFGVSIAISAVSPIPALASDSP